MTDCGNPAEPLPPCIRGRPSTRSVDRPDRHSRRQLAFRNVRRTKTLPEANAPLPHSRPLLKPPSSAPTSPAFVSFRPSSIKQTPLPNTPLPPAVSVEVEALLRSRSPSPKSRSLSFANPLCVSATSALPLSHPTPANVSSSRPGNHQQRPFSFLHPCPPRFYLSPDTACPLNSKPYISADIISGDITLILTIWERCILYASPPREILRAESKAKQPPFTLFSLFRNHHLLPSVAQNSPLKAPSNPPPHTPAPSTRIPPNRADFQ